MCFGGPDLGPTLFILRTVHEGGTWYKSPENLPDSGACRPFRQGHELHGQTRKPGRYGFPKLRSCRSGEGDLPGVTAGR